MNRLRRQLPFTIRANNSTLGQLAAGARQRAAGNTNSVDAINRLAFVTRITVVKRYFVAALTTMTFISAGCDLPERPPLPSSRRGSSIDLNDVEAVRRAAGLPALAEEEPMAIDPPSAMDRLYAIKTSPLAIGGSRVVGERRYRVESSMSRQTNDQDWLAWEDDQAPASFSSVFEVVDDGLLQKVASEQLWVRRNRCSVLVRSDVKESIQPDGSLASTVIRQQFGPMIRGAVGSVVEKPAGGFTFKIRSGFGAELNATNWVEQSFDWSARDRGLLATSDAVSDLVRATNPMPETASAKDLATKKNGADTAEKISKSRMVNVLIPDSDPSVMVRPPSKVYLQWVGQAAVPSDRVEANQYSRRLYEVAAAATLDSEDSSSMVREVYWADQAGLIHRKLRGDGLLEVLADTLEIEDLPKVPAGTAALLVSGRSFDPADTKMVAMRISGFDGDSLAGPGQSFRRGDETIEILLTRDGSGNESFQKMDRPTQSADTAATHLANFNQAAMRQWSRASSSATRSIPADTLLTDDFDQREGVDHRIARDTIAVTKSMLESRPNDPLFLPADKTIERGGGGPLARSMVLLTLLRGRGIASTLAMGIKATKPLGDEDRWMGFHVWVIASLDGKWFTIDVADEDELSKELATILPRTDRLLLATCDPTETEIESAMSRTLDLMSRMNLEIVGVR